MVSLIPGSKFHGGLTVSLFTQFESIVFLLAIIPFPFFYYLNSVVKPSIKLFYSHPPAINLADVFTAVAFFNYDYKFLCRRLMLPKVMEIF